MKKGKLLIITIMVLLLSMTTIYAQEHLQAAKSDIKLYLNGKKVDKEIVTVNESSYLPVRAISDALGLTIDWKSEERAIYLTDNSQGDEKVLAEALEMLQEENKKLKEQLTKAGIKVGTYTGEEVYLGKGIEHSSSEAFYGTVFYYNDKEVKDNIGNTYNNYLGFKLKNWSNKEDSISMDIPTLGQYEYFLGTIGIYEEYKDKYLDVKMEIFVDGQKIAEYTKQRGDLPEDIKVDIKGAQVVKIKVTKLSGNDTQIIDIFEPRFAK